MLQLGLGFLLGVVLCSTRSPLNVNPASIKQVDASELARTCTVRDHVSACTKFDWKISIDCRAFPEGRFGLAASAEVKPRIYFATPASLLHEQLHIEDLRKSLRKYFEALSSSQFDNRLACEEFASRERKTFDAVTEGVLRDSKERRDWKWARAQRRRR